MVSAPPHLHRTSHAIHARRPALLCRKIADSLKEAEELQGQVAALMDAGAGALLPPAQTSTAPALLAASVAEVQYLTGLSQIQSRILQQQRQLQGDLVYIVAHTWDTPSADPPHTVT